MPEKTHLSPRQTKDFFKSVATIGAGAKIYQDGYQYVDDVSFLNWMKNNVVKDGQMDSAEAIKNYFTTKPQGTRTLVRESESE
jgi:hypothetical protein